MGNGGGLAAGETETSEAVTADELVAPRRGGGRGDEDEAADRLGSGAVHDQDGAPSRAVLTWPAVRDPGRRFRPTVERRRRARAATLAPGAGGRGAACR